MSYLDDDWANGPDDVPSTWVEPQPARREDQPFSLFRGDGGPSAGGDGAHTVDADVFSPLDLRDRVTIMLLFKQIVTTDQVAESWRQWRSSEEARARGPLWRLIAARNDVDRERIFQEAAEVYAFKEHRVSADEAMLVIRAARRSFREKEWRLMQRAFVFPVARHTLPNGSYKWIFGAFDPTHPDIQQFMKAHVGTGELAYVPESVIRALSQEIASSRNEYLDRMHAQPVAYDLGTSYEQSGLLDEQALDAEISRSSLINLLEATLVEAVRAGASDIHVFPNAQKKIEIHMRVDGDLDLWHIEDRVHPEAFLAVIKDNTMDVDRFERENAQDGSMQRRIDNALIRFRVSVLPVVSASREVRSESIVIRVLDDRKVVKDLRDLGFLDLAMERFEQAIQQPHGMVIVTGPTGSGKSTTLYSALHRVVSPKRNVLTIEDPVEYVMPSVRQIKLTHKFGLEDALRSILRHDPDIVMVGEMRDRITADLAIKLANTGHLTFSTLHTNNAASAVNRLFKMGIEPFLIAYAVNLVVAQRLVRRLCADCKIIDDRVDPDLREDLGLPAEHVIYREQAEGQCRTCGGRGFRGRRAITETLPFTKTVRRIIVRSRGEINEDELRDTAIAEGMLTLRDSAREVVLSGETTIDEMIRATAGDM